MKGYAELEVFSAEEKLLFAEAKKIVRHFPTREQSMLIRLAPKEQSR